MLSDAIQPGQKPIYIRATTLNFPSPAAEPNHGSGEIVKFFFFLIIHSSPAHAYLFEFPFVSVFVGCAHMFRLILFFFFLHQRTVCRCGRGGGPLGTYPTSGPTEINCEQLRLRSFSSGPNRTSQIRQLFHCLQIRLNYTLYLTTAIQVFFFLHFYSITLSVREYVRSFYPV